MGIDFGTTHSCISTIKHRIPITIPLPDSNLLPSFVCFKDGRIIVGDIAKNEMENNLGSTIYASKRLIGRKFSDKEVQDDIPYLDYAIDEDHVGNVIMRVENGYHSTITPVDIATYVIKELKIKAEQYLKSRVEKAVICVPVYFNEKQRDDILKATENAGFKVLKIINEPTAAAVAYSFDKKIFSNKYNNINVNNINSNLLVYDLGGGTFDVAVIQFNNRNNNEIKVKAALGDNHLGGEDFTNMLCDYVLSKYNEKREELEMENSEDENFIKKYPILNRIQLSKLRCNCEIGKISLSKSSEVEIKVTENYSTKITLSEFNMIIMPLLERTIEITNKTIEKSKINKENISHVILVGGSSKMPIISECIKKEFPNSNICNNINPEEVVSIGAAIVANDTMFYRVVVIKNNNDIIEIVDNNKIPKGSTVLINYNTKEGIKDSYVVQSNIDHSYHLKSAVGIEDDVILPPLNHIRQISDVVTNNNNNCNNNNNSHNHTIGVEIIEKMSLKGIMDVLIDNNEKLPFFCKKRYRTIEDNQEFVKIRIFEGENKYTEENRLLDVFEIGPLPKLLKGEYQFYIFYEINQNYSLKLTATNVRGYPLGSRRVNIK